jgi:hypothetical protein
MRATYRAVAAVALGLPLLLAGPTMANAASHDPGDNQSSHHKKQKDPAFDFDQEIVQAPEQSNSTGSTEVNGDNNKVVNDLENSAPQSATETAFSDE